MFNRPMMKLALVALSLSGMSGCAQQPSGSANAKTGDAKTSMAAKNHTPVPKYGAALRYDYKMQKPVRANSNHSVTIVVDHDYAGQNLALTASADDGIAIATNRTSLPLVKGRKATWTIPFTTNADGLYYINVIGSVPGFDGSVETRAYSVRVEVGNQPKQNKPVVKEVILPAEETIS